MQDQGLISQADSLTLIVLAYERVCRCDMICSPVVLTTSLLISNRELGLLIPYSLQGTRIIFVAPGIDPVATGEEDILGLRLGAIPVFEL